MFCFICLKNLNNIYNSKYLGCSHSNYHKECLDNWCSKHKYCPFCFLKIKENKISEYKDFTKEYNKEYNKNMKDFLSILLLLSILKYDDFNIKDTEKNDIPEYIDNHNIHNIDFENFNMNSFFDKNSKKNKKSKLNNVKSIIKTNISDIDDLD